MRLSELFAIPTPVIGMLHVPALPGSPANTERFDAIRDWVLRDAEALVQGGVDGLLIENFGDAPFYPHRVPAHTVAFLAVLAREVKARHAAPLGVNVLRNDGLAAMAVATASGADFIRVNVYTGARLADQGILEGEAHRIQRCRRALASGVRVFADVAVKHSAALAARDLADEIEDTVSRGGADAIIISGGATGRPASLDDLKTARMAAGAAPVLAGSGVSILTLAAMLSHCDGAIVGTTLKKDAVTTNPVDPLRVREFMDAVAAIRRS